MFILNMNTVIESNIGTKPVDNAINILKRDIKKVINSSDIAENRIVLLLKADMASESYSIDVADKITITAGDDLGFIYGLLHISEKYLGITPFWFWMDQEIKQVSEIKIETCHYEALKPLIKYRGWFYNDEVLMMKWEIDGDEYEPWRMAFEALLRCGGNMAIPGTDKNVRKYRQLALDYGLWITHHHAEPLGAEMFVRAYPNLNANYDEYPDLFLKLWEEAIIEQKDMKVVWNLSFRGQGDCPFWSVDSSGKYNTHEERGRLISELINKQKQLVEKHVNHPVLCTNLYGEIMELYNEGYIKIDSDIIKIYADNGFGKMVTRRRDNHCVRIASLPQDNDTQSGIYYHVSFYDLQAANHLTMLPNSVEFVNSELSKVIDQNATTYWLINCSNVRPHVYYLDAIRKKWYGENITDRDHSIEFVSQYFNGNDKVAKNIYKRPKMMMSYGQYEDEYVGEQFYNENVRLIITHLIRNRTDNLSELRWIAGDVTFNEQIKRLYEICQKGYRKIKAYYEGCVDISNELSGSSKMLFDATIFLQAKIHYECAKGMLICEKACNEYFDEDYKAAFLSFGYSAEHYLAAHHAMRSAEYGVWNGFYKNDCLADIKHTAYMLRKMMGVVREKGDNARHDKWYRDAVYSDEDRNVYTLLVLDNHMTDHELFEVMKSKGI